MPHQKYNAFNRLVWNSHTNSFELITRISYKKNKKTRAFVMDTCKRTVDSDKAYFRNMIKYMLTPWLFIHPQDIVGYYGCEPYGKDKKWWQCNSKTGISYVETKQSKEKIIELVEKYEPNFIYTLRAYKNDSKYYLTNLFEIYKMWKKYPYECEMLIKLGYYHLATQKSIYKLSKTKKQQYIKTLVKDHPYGQYATITDIQEYILGIENSYLFRQCKRNKKLYDYLVKQNHSVDFYYDYKRLAEILHKDLTQEYWLYPKDLFETHNRLHEEQRAIWEAQRLAREEQERKTRNEYIEKLQEIPQLQKLISGYSLYLANSMSDIENQAKILHQCLITCKYYEKVAKKSSLLIFIKKDDEPIGTCEIGYDKAIKQFYLDELDRDNMNPSQELKDITNAYIPQLNINNITKTITI